MFGYLANILNLLIQTPDKFSVIKDCFCLSSSSYYSGFMQYWLRVRDWVAVKLDQMVCWKWDFCKKTNNICISLKLTMISCGTTIRSISTAEVQIWASYVRAYSAPRVRTYWHINTETVLYSLSPHSPPVHFELLKNLWKILKHRSINASKSCALWKKDYFNSLLTHFP